MFKNLEEDLNFTQSLFLPIISFTLLWILHLVLTIINIHPLSVPLQIIKNKKSKDILPMLTTDHMEFFPLFLLSTLNFHLVRELLTLFLIAFLSILTIKEKMIKFISNNLTQWLLIHCHRHLLPSLQQMLVSKTMSPCPFHTLTFQTDLCPGRFIIQLLSLVLKQNYLLSDMALIKPRQLITSQRSLLSLTPFMWPGKSSTLCLICIKSMQ